MNLNDFKTVLNQNKAESIGFLLPNGQQVPAHFHLTEVSLVDKFTYDCGGNYSKKSTLVLQLWVANDTQHRLSPQKMLHIIEASKALSLPNEIDVEVEYQTETIGRYGVTSLGDTFHLTSLHTACPAPDACGVPVKKKSLPLAQLGNANVCCTVDGCC